MRDTGNHRRLGPCVAAWFVVLGASSFAQGQDASPIEGAPVERTQRTGIVKSKSNKVRFENRYELDQLGLVPTGYAFTVRGRDQGDDFVLSEVELTSPDGSKTIRMTRFDEHAQVRSEGSGLVVKDGAVDRALRENSNLGLEAVIRRVQRQHQEAGYYSLRGWAIDVEEQGRVERTLLLDAVRATIKRRGRYEWVTAVYGGGNPRVVVEEEGGDRSRKHSPRQFKLARNGEQTMLLLPAFSRARDSEVRSGVVRARKTPARIENHHELVRLDLVPTGYSYVLTGREALTRFNVDELELTSPDGARSIRMTRYDALAVVRASDAGLVAQEGSRVRTLLKNHDLNLREELAAEARKHAAPGTYRLRGWAIDIEDADGVQRSLLLDGVRAQIKKRDEPVWIAGLYDARQRMLIDDGKQVRNVAWRPKRVRFLRSEAPPAGVARSSSKHGGMTAVLGSASRE